MTYNEMKAKLIEFADSYYNKSESMISDAEFDKLKDQFVNLYPDDDFVNTIGSPISIKSQWKKADHKIPMRSCNKVNTTNEFKSFVDNCGMTKDYLMVSEKLDGISVSLNYIDGKLVQAITRGDSWCGEEITDNVIKMMNVSKRLPDEFTGSLRGEIIISLDDFKRLNDKCKENGEEPFSNARNAASGIARKIDGKYTKYLKVLYYFITSDFNTKEDDYKFIEKKLKLETCTHYKVDLNVAIEIYDDYEIGKREMLNHEIDGLVIEPDNKQTLECLGELGGNYKGQIAWKFSNKKAKTKLIDVIWQVGNSQRLTPVAIVEAVNIAGVTIRKASLHNLENFIKLIPYKNAECTISRRGDVIPYLESIESPKESVDYFKAPTHCPICKQSLNSDGVFLQCTNDSCEALYLGNLNTYVKKIELKGLAESTIESLFESGLIRYPADLYNLTVKDISKLGGFGISSANNIVNTINNKRELTFGEFVGALNISNVSTKTGDLLESNGYTDFNKIINCSVSELSSIGGIGEITAKAIIDGFERKSKIIEELLCGCVTIKLKKKVEVSDMNHFFTNKRVVFTGALEIKRKEAQKMVEDVGGIIQDEISKDTDILVCADPTSGSSKLKKAEKNGTNIISEKQFMIYFE